MPSPLPLGDRSRPAPGAAIRLSLLALLSLGALLLALNLRASGALADEAMQAPSGSASAQEGAQTAPGDEGSAQSPVPTGAPEGTQTTTQTPAKEEAQQPPTKEESQQAPAKEEPQQAPAQVGEAPQTGTPAPHEEPVASTTTPGPDEAQQVGTPAPTHEETGVTTTPPSQEQPKSSALEEISKLTSPIGEKILDSVPSAGTDSAQSAPGTEGFAPTEPTPAPPSSALQPVTATTAVVASTEEGSTTLPPGAGSGLPPVKPSASQASAGSGCNLSGWSEPMTSNCTAEWLGGWLGAHSTPPSPALGILSPARSESTASTGPSGGQGHEGAVVSGRSPSGPTPGPAPSGASGGAGPGGSGVAFSGFVTLAALLLLAAPRALRRLRLSCRPWLTAFFVLIPERPG